jgi:hypothetical protein
MVRSNIISGMKVSALAILRVSNSVSTNNGLGFNNASGTLETRGNNTVAGNRTNVAVPAVIVPINGM